MHVGQFKSYCYQASLEIDEHLRLIFRNLKLYKLSRRPDNNIRTLKKHGQSIWRAAVALEKHIREHEESIKI